MAALQTDRRRHSIDDAQAQCTLTGGRQDEPRPGLASHGPGRDTRGRGSAKDLRRQSGPEGPHLLTQRRQGPRVPGSQRRRQDHLDPDPHHDPPPVIRSLRRRRHQLGTSGGDPSPNRRPARRAGIPQADDSTRVPDVLRAALRPAGRRGPTRRLGPARGRGPAEPGGVEHRLLQPRHATAARHRTGTRQRPGRRLPRRTDPGAGPAWSAGAAEAGAEGCQGAEQGRRAQQPPPVGDRGRLRRRREHERRGRRRQGHRRRGRRAVPSGARPRRADPCPGRVARQDPGAPGGAARHRERSARRGVARMARREAAGLQRIRADGVTGQERPPRDPHPCGRTHPGFRHRWWAAGGRVPQVDRRGDPMSQDLRRPGSGSVAPPGRSSSPWWLIFKQESSEMWASGRVLRFLTLYAILMSVTAYLLATNNDLKLVTMKASVVVAVTSTITFGLFIGLVIGAESISGERERATLEPLLLTPSGPRQVVAGKFLSALSAWPGAMLLTLPYLVVLAQGHTVLGSALVWGGVVGTLLAAMFVGFSLIVSIWSESSRVSLFVCLLAYVASLIPAQLPTEFLRSPAGVVLTLVDPVESASQFLDRVIGSGQQL